MAEALLSVLKAVGTGDAILVAEIKEFDFRAKTCYGSSGFLLRTGLGLPTQIYWPKGSHVIKSDLGLGKYSSLGVTWQLARMCVILLGRGKANSLRQ